MKKMLVIFMLFLSGLSRASPEMSEFDRFFCAGVGSQGECVLYRVSIVNLIATPERFHGKKVQVIGYLEMGAGHIWLSLGKNSFQNEGVLLVIHEGEIETREDFEEYKNKEKRMRLQFGGRVVLMEGEFDMDISSSQLRGGIRDIVRIQRWGR